MIVDTSALVASLLREPHFETLRDALAREAAIVPAPVVVEYNLVTSLPTNDLNPVAAESLAQVLAEQCTLTPFGPEDAVLSAEAHRLYGRGNGRGGKLNMLDIMVYCMAKRLDQPILCTGRDFATTDARIHPASRGW